MTKIHSDIDYICKTNTEIIELEIFKFIKVALLISFFLRMYLGLIEYFINPKKIDPIPDIEESIYYTLHSQKILFTNRIPRKFTITRQRYYLSVKSSPRK